MRRGAALTIVLGIVIVLAPVASSQDKLEPITIQYHGASFYVVTTSKGKNIGFDPHLIPEYAIAREDELKADIICVSHNHNDHTRVQAFGNYKKAKILQGLKGDSLKATWNFVDETIDDIKIRNIGTFHDEQEGLLRGKNSIFIVEVDGWRIVHLGDLGHLLTPAQVKKIGPVDILMIPCGGIYTLNGDEAKKVVEQLKPKEYVFPMHYGTKVFDPVLTAEEFLEAFPKRNVAIHEDNVLKLNKEAARPRPMVVQLHYWPKEKKEEKKEEKKK